MFVAKIIIIGFILYEFVLSDIIFSQVHGLNLVNLLIAVFLCICVVMFKYKKQ